MTVLTLTADMPIIVSGQFELDLRRNPRLFRVLALPRLMFPDASERQCQANHSGQTLERMRKRHGISALEALAILSVTPFADVQMLGEGTAHRILYAWSAALRRGALP